MPTATDSAVRPATLLTVAWWLFVVWVLATYGKRLVFLLLAELVFDIPTGIEDRDFANYWVGGKLALSGDYLLLFDPARYYAHLQQLFWPDYQPHAWSYPPHFLTFMTPLGLLEYRPGLFLFQLVTFLLFAAAAWAFIRRYAPEVSKPLVALALTGFVLMQVEATQNGFLTSAMVLGVFAFMRERPVLAGLALALLTVKPQLGFLIPLLALLDRDWKLIGWASAFTVLLVGISLALFGVESWRQYFAQIVPYQNYVMTDWSGIFLRMMPSTFGSVRTLGFSPSTAFAVQAVVSVAAFAVMARLLFVLEDPLERVFALTAGTFLISPYSFNYDMGALSVMAACLALRARAQQRHGAMAIYGALAVLPACMTPLGLKMLPIAPLVIAAGVAALWIGARRTPGTTPATS